MNDRLDLSDWLAIIAGAVVCLAFAYMIATQGQTP